MLGIVADKAARGVRVRFTLGDPDSAFVAQRGQEEGIGDAMAAKIRNALTLYRGLAASENVEIRLHQAVLYNSIYRADDQLFVNQHAYGVQSRPELTPAEWHEVGRLAQVTQKYTSLLVEPEFSPVIPGCGVVDSAVGDVLTGAELIEIKTVGRLFRVPDLRQALTYAAMLYSAGRGVEHITLLNPRRARVVKMSIGRIAAGVRGGSAVELLQDLMEAMIELQVSA
jgi:hypothetical protein